MGVSIRRTQVRDLQQIENLYEHSKVSEELRWVFSNPENPDELNSWVAFDEVGNLAGVVGYAISGYTYLGTTWKGVISMSWMVAPKYRGLLGIQLLKKALGQADFSFTLAGSLEARSLYHAFKLNYIRDANTYFKLFRPYAYMKSWQGRSLPRRIFYMARLYQTFLAGIPSLKESALQLVPSGIFPEYSESDSCFRKEMTAGYYKWLLDCPLHETQGFHILRGETVRGVAVCYIRKTSGNTSRARIVHVSTLDDFNEYKSVIGQLSRFLIDRGCSSVSILANQSDFRKSLKKLGFVKLRTKKKPYFINDRNKILPSQAILSEWNIQYSEGDKAYRDI
ncbi:MAG: hypothetical protein JW801_14095 [Bacteroidales bacterium]|nr:hypothetical protein [Bacteroidales bacterium]